MSNREALLDAALACIKEKGYAQTTARDLVERSDTNLGAIGYHFGSKERLLNEAIYLGFEEWLAAIAATVPEDAADADADVWQLLELSFAAVLDNLREQRPLCLAFVEALAQAERSDQLREQMAAGYERYRRAVAAYLAAAVPPARQLAEPQSTALAALIVAAGDGLLIQSLLDPDALPDAATLTSSVRSALDG